MSTSGMPSDTTSEAVRQLEREKARLIATEESLFVDLRDSVSSEAWREVLASTQRRLSAIVRELDELNLGLRLHSPQEPVH